MSRDREHIVGNQSPKAKIYFVDKDWSLRDEDFIGPKVLTPDVDDVLELRTSRGTTGHSGNFTLVLNNKDNKYFIKDDIEDEIKQLNTLDNREPAKEKNELYGKDSYPYVDMRDFLNEAQITLRYDIEDNRYGEHKPGVDTSFMLQQDENSNWGYFNIPAKDMADNEISQENAAKYWVSLSSDEQKRKEENATHNFDFFIEHGGDLDQGRCMFEPMQRVVVLLSRRFPNENSELQTVFTGLVSSVSDSYQENLYTITIQGEDLTKWLRVTQINMNPSFVRVSDLPGSGDFLITQHKFADMEGWQVIQTLILGGKTQTQQEFGGLGRWSAVKEHRMGPDKTPMRDKPTLENIQEITPVGLPGEWIGPSESGNEQILKKDKLHLQVYHGVTAKKDKGTHIITPYKLFFRQSANTFDNEYSTVWDVATDVAKLTNFEFYADAYGDLWYHQPRFNNYHILNAVDQGVHPEVYVIRDEDIVSHDFTESDENIVTSLFVTGMQDLIKDFPIPLGLANFYEDYSFVRKYGRRFLFTHHPYVRTSQDCWYFAKSLMQRINAERFTGQITILGRPEIDPAMPVYIAYKNTIYYIKEVSHSFTFGGRFTTTLQLTYGRKPWEILPEILDYKTIPPQLASKELEKYSTIDVFPVEVEFVGIDKNLEEFGAQLSSTPACYVVARDKELFQNQVQMSRVAGGFGYLLSTTFGWGHQGRTTEQLQSDLAAGTERTTVKVKATIDGYIDLGETMSERLGLVRIQGTGNDALFAVTYVGLGGNDYKRLLRNVENKRKNGELYFVKAGESILGELSHTVLQGFYALQPQLYYAVQLGDKPVWPNEVHTTKFVDKQGDVWLDSKREEE